ncbi:MAG: ATPase-like protein [Actinomycetia bacterium]|nr:ATPase-like protein [Actinomycetes bacterium]
MDKRRRQNSSVSDMVVHGPLTDPGYVTTSERSEGTPSLSRSLVDGRATESLAMADHLLAEGSLAGAALASVEVASLLALVLLGDLGQVRARAGAILARTGPGVDGAMAGALTAMAYIAWDEGRVADAMVLLRAGVERRDEVAEPMFGTYVGLTLSSRLRALGEVEASAAALADCEVSGDPVWAAGPPVFRAGLRLSTGDVAGAVQEAERGLALASWPPAALFAGQARGVLTSAALIRGDTCEVRRQLAAARRLPIGRQALAGQTAELWFEGRLADIEGGPADAVRRLDLVYDGLTHHRRLMVEDPAAAAWLTRAALAAGATGRAQRVASTAEQLAVDNPDYPTLVAVSDHVRGLVDRDPAALERAAANHRQPWARASALEDAGTVLEEVGARSAGLARLGEAVYAYEDAGASHDVTRVRRRVDEVQGRVPRRRRLPRPVSGWHSLTDAERTVAEVVAEGLTNRAAGERLYLSRHTVDAHLRQIFRKLEVGSRVEMTRRVLEET